MTTIKAHAQARQTARLTHFLCLPLVTPLSKDELGASVRTFRDQVVAPEPQFRSSPDDDVVSKEPNNSLRILPAKAVRHVSSLHLTLGVMSLNTAQLLDATELLKGFDVKSALANAESEAQAKINPSEMKRTEESQELLRYISEQACRPIKIVLKGLTSMHNAAATSILYIAPEDPTSRLYPLCLAVQQLFRENGFLIEDNRPLKLHATIVNTIYAKGKKRHSQREPRRGAGGLSLVESKSSSSGHGIGAKGATKVNAIEILEHFKEFVWAKGLTLDRIAICEMGAKKILDHNGNLIDEKYTEVVSLALPS